MSQEEFARYEDMAIDGRLIYDEYPAEEYKYFSQLSRLGYKNRHEGWQKRYARTSRRNISGSIFTAKSETAGFSGKPA